MVYCKKVYFLLVFSFIITREIEQDLLGSLVFKLNILNFVYFAYK